MIKIVDIANEIWKDLGQPIEAQIPYISTWLRENVGEINTLIFTDFVIDRASQEIISRAWYNKICNQPPPICNTPPCSRDFSQYFHDEEKIIFKKIFQIKYYDTRINSLLYAAQFDTIVSAKEGDSEVTRKLVKNDLVKSFITLKKDAEDRLIYLTHLYKYSKSTPTQVTGDDFITPVPYEFVGDYGPGSYY